MSPAPRYAEKFTSLDGSTFSYTFPLVMYEYERGEQGIASAALAASGGDYAVRLLGTARGPKPIAKETVRFLNQGTPAEIEGEFEDALEQMVEVGLGKLWSLGSDSSRRWCYAELAAVPGMLLTTSLRMSVAQVLEFNRFSDWYDEEAIGEDGEFTLDDDPDAITVNNPGNAPVYNAVITLKGTFTNPVITNTENGDVLQSTRDGSNPDHWLRFDCGRNVVEFSTDGGDTWADDYANFVRASGQVRLMRFEPGNNDLTVAGADTADLVFEFYGAWH